MSTDFRMPVAHDQRILQSLDEDGGFTALTLSDMTGLPRDGNGRMRSGAMRSWLSLLERRGFVRKMDDQKPICWMRTPNGTQWLNSMANQTS